MTPEPENQTQKPGRPPTTEELLARLPEIPHTGSYGQRDIGSLSVPYILEKKPKKPEEKPKPKE